MIYRYGTPATTAIIEEAPRLLEYVDGKWRPVLGERLAAVPTVEDVLRAHQWEHWPRRCACGWRQRGWRTNHPRHVASMLRYRSLVYPPAAEFIHDRPR